MDAPAKNGACDSSYSSVGLWRLTTPLRTRREDERHKKSSVLGDPEGWGQSRDCHGNAVWRGPGCSQFPSMTRCLSVSAEGFYWTVGAHTCWTETRPSIWRGVRAFQWWYRGQPGLWDSSHSFTWASHLRSSKTRLWSWVCSLRICCCVQCWPPSSTHALSSSSIALLQGDTCWFMLLWTSMLCFTLSELGLTQQRRQSGCGTDLELLQELCSALCLSKPACLQTCLVTDSSINGNKPGSSSAFVWRVHKSSHLCWFLSVWQATSSATAVRSEKLLKRVLVSVWLYALPWHLYRHNFLWKLCPSARSDWTQPTFYT